MLRLILKQTLAHRGRLLLTYLAVTLGVTFVTGALVLTDTSRRVFDDQFRSATTQVDVVVRDAVAFDDAMGVEVERDPLPPQLVDQITDVPGVEEAIGVAKGSGLLVHDGKPIVPSGPSVLSSWNGLDGFTIRAGTTPDAPGEIVIDQATAKIEEIEIGDTLTVQSQTDAELQVVGLAGFGDSDGLPNSTIALVALPTAQRLLDIGDRLSQISVTAAGDVPAQTLADRINDTVTSNSRSGGGAGVEAEASRDTAAASADAAKDQLDYVTLILLALAGAAFLIGAFLIANTFSVLVTQRTRELAVLRASGASGRQVVASVLGEAAAVGISGAASGLAAGVGAAYGLRALVAGFGVTIPDGSMLLTGRTVAVGILVGCGVTLLSALGAARRAARVSPVTALRAGAVDTADRIGRGRKVTGTLGAGAGGLLVAAGVVTSALALVAAGAVLVVAGLVLLAPVVAPAAAALVGRAALRPFGTTGALARETTRRAARRTGATVTALTLSLGLIVFVSVAGASITSALRSSYQEVVTADLVVESARGEMLGGLTPTAYDRVRDLKEVAVVSRIRYGHWKEDGGTRALTAIDPATITEVADIDMVEGTLGDLDSGGIVLADSAARSRGLEVGEELVMTFARTGDVSVPVVGLVDDGDAKALSTDFLISTGAYRSWYSERMDASLLIRAADGTHPETAQAAVERALGDLPTADVRDQAAAVAERTTMLDGILGLVTVMLVLTVLIAMLGITNTLALSIVERTRELGTLRAVGMTRRQLRTMIRGEAVLIAAVGLLLGTGVGTGLAAVLVAAIAGSTDLTVVIPVTGLLVVLGVGLLVGVVAGVSPARRAGRLDVLTALRET